jgi:hypothetical protein
MWIIDSIPDLGLCVCASLLVGPTRTPATPDSFPMDIVNRPLPIPPRSRFFPPAPRRGGVLPRDPWWNPRVPRGQRKLDIVVVLFPYKGCVGGC